MSAINLQVLMTHSPNPINFTDDLDNLKTQLRAKLDEFFQGEPWEHVNILKEGTTDEYIDMFVDENGVAKGLPVNQLATEHYQRNAIVHQGAKPEDLSKIHGNAVLFLGKVWE